MRRPRLRLYDFSRMDFKKSIPATIAVLWAASLMPAQMVTTLHRFDQTDGANPAASLVQGSDGDLYGTTQYGGAAGYGTVFKITPNGKLT